MGTIPSKQRVERKEKSRLKNVKFSGKKEGQPGDGKSSVYQLYNADARYDILHDTA